MFLARLVFCAVNNVASNNALFPVLSYFKMRQFYTIPFEMIHV